MIHSPYYIYGPLGDENSFAFVCVTLLWALHIVIIIIITDLYSAFRSEDTEALNAAQED